MNIKKYTYNFILLFSIVLNIFLGIIVILSHLDFKFNILTQDNWIDIMLCLITIIPTSIFSYLIFKQAKDISNRQEKFEVELLQKQFDASLRENRLNVYNTFMSLKYIERIYNSDIVILNFINQNHEENKKIFDLLLKKEEQIILALCNSKLLFKNDLELEEQNDNLAKLIIAYRECAQEFAKNIYKANDEALSYLHTYHLYIPTKVIPKNVITKNKKIFNDVKEIFRKYTEDLKNKISDISDIFDGDYYMNLYDKYINIDIKDSSIEK